MHQNSRRFLGEVFATLKRTANKKPIKTRKVLVGFVFLVLYCNKYSLGGHLAVKPPSDKLF